MTKTKTLKIEKMAALLYTKMPSHGVVGKHILAGWYQHEMGLTPETSAHWVGWLWREMVFAR